MSAREKFESLFSSLSEADTVAPSKIGGQFYCERKIDLELEHGEVETPEKQRGSATHEKAAEDAVEVEMDEIWDAIERGDRQIVVESTFVGEAADFVVVGIPDAIIFDDSKPQLIFDRKTTSIPGRLFDNQRIQVWLYGYMLQSLGFDTGDLQLAILSHEQAIDAETGKRLQEMVLTQYADLADGQTELLTDPGAVVYLFNYNPIDHIEELSWALEYWRHEREPEPAENVAKCRSCPYSDVCTDSLV